MAWFTANWFWVLIFIAFIAMHMFGYGCCGGHKGHDKKKNEAEGSVANKSLSGHQH